MSASPPSTRLLRTAALGGAALAVAGGAAFYWASQQRGAPVAADAVTVAVTAKACEPNALTVAAGKRTFEIVNKSDRPVEWEILDGVMVVEERENIAPGFRQTLTARLAPGTYAITCGLLSNPRGTLTVTPSEESRAAASRLDVQGLVGALSEYRVYLLRQGAAMVRASGDLSLAVAGGDLAAARAAYRTARDAYLRAAPVAARFSDLEAAIDPRAEYLALREKDPAFTGYPRLARGLFVEETLSGLAPVAERLAADLARLKERLRSVAVEPALLTESPAKLAARLAQGRAERAPGLAAADRADRVAALSGLAKAAELLLPVAARPAPKAAAELEDKLVAAFAAVDGGAAEPAFAALGDAFSKVDTAMNGGEK
ncbi:iron uptake system protein EfeO [Oleispirillum naphthae]|uniref:iron uptake system protein EfeO n=1 Tax=Oleispirillum naphthae TaxID=2838853 RepID=UPI003082335E